MNTAKIEFLMKHSASLDLQIEQQLGQMTSYALIYPSPQIVGNEKYVQSDGNQLIII